MNALLSVKCRHCLANVGSPCTIPGTLEPLRLSPAHPSRMEDAGSRPDYSVVGKYREMFPNSARSAPLASSAPEGDTPPPDDGYVPQRDDEPVASSEPTEGR